MYIYQILFLPLLYVIVQNSSVCSFIIKLGEKAGDIKVASP